MQAFSLTTFLLNSCIKANHHLCITEQDRNTEQNCQVTYLPSRVSSLDFASIREKRNSLQLRNAVSELAAPSIGLQKEIK